MQELLMVGVTGDSTPRGRANQLVDDVRDDPVRVADETAAALAEDLADDVRSIMMRAAGLAARYAGTMEQSIQLLTDSRELATAAGEPALATEAALSLAGSLALSGDTEAALVVLEPDPHHPPNVAARFDFQRASVLGRLGRATEALESFEQALPRFQSFGDVQFEAFTRANLGRLRLDIGDLDGAEEDLVEAVRLHTELGNEVSVAYQQHNLGEVSACRGDLVSALTQLDKSSEALRRLTTTSYEPQVSLGETLIAAGLHVEAAALARQLDNELEQTNLSLDRAEAQLLQARAYVGLRQWAEARTAADRAAKTFAAQGRQAWVHRAALLAIHSTPHGDTDAELARKTIDLAAELRELGQHGAAAEATAEAVIRYCRAGNLEAAATHLETLNQQPGSGWMVRRFLTTYAKANWCAATGDRRGALRAIRHGVELSERHRLSLGATELVAGTASHTASLLNLARRLALDSTDQRMLFRWSERSRASAMRLQPVLPPVDDQMATRLADLRTAERQLVAAPLVDQAELAAQHSRAMQRLVRQERLIQRPETSGSEPLASVTLSQVQHLLAGDAGTDRRRTPTHGLLLSLTEIDDRVWAQLISETKVQRFDLGDITAFTEGFGRLRRRVDALVRVAADNRSAATIVDAIHSDREKLDALFDFLPEEIPLVLVPPPSLFDAPWRLLSSLADRELTVAPSSSLWARSPRNDVGDGVGLVAGPDLALATAEVTACAGQHRSPETLTGLKATADAVVQLLEQVDLAHITCHGRFRRGNVQLSSLQLADGPLMVIELERLHTVPRCLVLSACSASAAEVLGESEVLGLASTFIRLGSEAVVAGNGLVQDSPLTVSAMTVLHEHLDSGATPEAALRAASAQAQSPEAKLLVDAGFIVYGTRRGTGGPE